MPLLSVAGLTVRYGAIHAVRGIDIAVEAGEVVAVLGANGAGKSTTLKAIVGLVPAGGEIRFDGAAIQGWATEQIVRRGVTLVPEGRRVFPSLTVLENLTLGAAACADRGSADRHRAEVFDLFPILAERRSQRAGTLSGGQQQMVAIARALSGNVRLLLLDEPFEGLSPAMVEEVFKTIGGLRAEVSILIIEHHLDLVLALADRAYVLDRGQVSHEGPAQPLLTDLEFRKQVLWL